MTLAADLSLLGKQRPVALITGGARRVGAATCRELARRGCDVLVTYRTSADEAAELLEDLREIGVQAATAPLDLADTEGAESFGAALAKNLHRLDVVVHNASVYSRTPLETVTAKDTLRAFTVHAAAPLLLTRALAPLLRGSTLEGGGSIVAMADIHAMGRPRKRNFIAYSMSKAALVELVRSLARELAPDVRVNAVAPGVVAFPESGYESDEESQRAYLRRVPLERAGTPEDAARAVAWLALGATYCTGQIIRVDGGRWLI